MSFNQGQTQISNSSVRLTVYEVFKQFGSYLAFIIRFTVLILSGFQSHSLQDSLAKRLYSAEKEKRLEEEDDNFGLMSYQEDPSEIDDATRLNDAILNREKFKYGYWKFWRFDYASSRCFCCCRKKAGRQEFLMKDAKSKLNAETDLLEIIKKLRVHQFASEMALKPSQRDLINFFDVYKLKTPEQYTQEKIATSQVKTDKDDERGTQTDQLVNVTDVVNSGKEATRILKAVNIARNAEDPIDKAILDRIISHETM